MRVAHAATKLMAQLHGQGILPRYTDDFYLGRQGLFRPTRYAQLVAEELRQVAFTIARESQPKDRRATIRPITPRSVILLLVRDQGAATVLEIRPRLRPHL